MELEITEVNRHLGYVCVVELETHQEYFSQGEEGQRDIDFIDTYGEVEFLKLLAPSGFF